MHIGEYIKYKRISLGYTQQNLADFLSISKQAVHKWEKSLSIPDIMILPPLGSVLKVHPKRLVEMIWLGESEAAISHFVHIIITNKSGESYVIKSYESKDFIPATEIYNGICSGKNTELIQKLVNYYECDPSIKITIELTETEYDIYGEIPSQSLIIDSQELDSIIKDYYLKENE